MKGLSSSMGSIRNAAGALARRVRTVLFPKTWRQCAAAIGVMIALVIADIVGFLLGHRPAQAVVTLKCALLAYGIFGWSIIWCFRLLLGERGKTLAVALVAVVAAIALRSFDLGLMNAMIATGHL